VVRDGETGYLIPRDNLGSLADRMRRLRAHFPHFMIAISRHGGGLCLEAEGGGRDPHEGEDLLVERAEFGLEHLDEAVALA